MSADSLTPHELIDIVAGYYPRVDLSDFGPNDDPDDFVQQTPEFKIWMARMDEGWDRMDEWRQLLDRMRLDLSTLNIQNNTIPLEWCYSTSAYPKNAPKLAHGDTFSVLVARVSMLAPVYEIYESRRRIVMTGMDRDQMRYRDQRQTHELSPEYQHAADVLARAIEEQYGYQRLWPEVLDIRIVHLAVWGYTVNRITLADALFSNYRL